MNDCMHKLVRLRNDVFVRSYFDYGYIMNQLNYLDRYYSKSGAVFLKSLSRTPQTLETICHDIYSNFSDIDYETVKVDAIEFFENLAEAEYIVMGTTPEELDNKDFGFSYNLVETPKTIKDYFEDKSLRHLGVTNTQDELDKLFRENPLLQTVELEITRKCNERCVHCYIPHEDKSNDIEPKLYYSILDQLAEMGTLGLTITGGEPLLHPNILDFLRYAHKKDFKISILSNATCLTNEIITVFKEVRLNMIAISLYSMCPEEHDLITQLQGSFEKTKRNIEKMLTNDIPMQINCPLTKINYSSFKEVLKWCRERKLRPYVDHLLMARYDFSDSNLDYRMNDEQLELFLRDSMEQDINYQKRLEQPSISSQITKKEREEKIICGAGVSSACINSEGNIFPCAGWQQYNIGNASVTKIKDIWENSEKVQWLRNLRWRNFPKCIDCEASDYCAMCLARNFNDSKGDMLHLSDRYCEYAFMNKRLADEYRAKPF